MKTKEIEAVICKDFTNDNVDNWFFKMPEEFNYGELDIAKARIIIEIPEKKIEITESEFARIWIDYQNSPREDKCRDILKDLLFNKQ